MEGRRVNRPAQKANPLFLLFCGLVAATAILLIVSIVLGVRLGSANKKLNSAEEKVAALTEAVESLQAQLKAAESSSAPADDMSAYAPSGSAVAPEASSSAAGGSWLDLSGHSELAVKPTSLLDSFATYYTTAGVNLRSGPATSYERITTVELGTKVDVAAREGNWSFVQADGKYGWINSDYLSTSQPSVQTSASSTRNSSSSSSTRSTTRSEATSGSLKKK